MLTRPEQGAPGYLPEKGFAFLEDEKEKNHA